MKKNAVKKSWVKAHRDDFYVKKAKQEHFRSRAVYKLQALQRQYQLVTPGMTVIDLGAAPGGWSQLVKQYLKNKGQIIAIDILPMAPITEVTIIQGDFCKQMVTDQLLAKLDGHFVDLVLSDMAPNLSGNHTIDQPRIINLCQLALGLVQKVLKSRGNFLVKSFQGREFEHYLHGLRCCFDKVIVCKPKASLPRSKECYLLAKTFKR